MLGGVGGADCLALLVVLVRELVKVDKDWVPEGEGYSIYLRPTAISTYVSEGSGSGASGRSAEC